jgi:ubiquinone/menaquinone biosynthesis C-methylase UbiE
VSFSTDRFARTAERVAAHQDARADRIAQQARDFAQPRGDERALDVGTGAGALALALAALVREVVGLDPVPELLALARERSRPNTAFVEGDGAALPFPDGAFDLAATHRTLHHVPQPERVIAEMARVTRPGGQVLVVDQLAPDDQEAADSLHAFESERDPSHTRLLTDGQLRELFAANELELVRARHEEERRELAAYLDLAGCEGERRVRAETLAATDPRVLAAEVGWYLLARSEWPVTPPSRLANASRSCARSASSSVKESMRRRSPSGVSRR